MLSLTGHKRDISLSGCETVRATEGASEMQSEMLAWREDEVYT